MPKHNIDAIAASTLAAQAAYERASSPVPPVSTDEEADPVYAQKLANERIRVLEAIHGQPKDDEGGTLDERRADRLFSSIVKALTVALR